MSEKFSYAVTLTDSYVRTLGVSATTGTTTPYNYNVIRPNFTLRYKPHDDHFFTFSFSRGYGKPNFTYLNPFRKYESPVYFVEGNPNLKHSITYNLKLNYRFRYWLNFGVSYVNATNTVLQVPQLDADGAIIGYTYGNFGQSDDLKFTLNLSKRLFDKRLNLGFNGQAEYMLYNSGDVLNYRNSMWSYYGNLDFSYVLIKKYDMEFGGYALYTSSHLSGYARTQGIPKVGLHLSARFLDGNLQTSLSVNDVFNTDVNNRESLLNGIVSKSDNLIDARYIRLSVRYSFNRKNLKRFENHQGYNGDSNRL